MKRSFKFLFFLVCIFTIFTVYNYSLTHYALIDVLGNIGIFGLSWATIFSITFCGIDFAGIARLFSSQKGMDEPAGVFYPFGAWMLAAAMNAMLSWWGLSVAMKAMGNHIALVPVIAAIFIWISRTYIIGNFMFVEFGKGEAKSL